MPVNFDFTLESSTKSYKVFNNQFIFVWDVKSPEDSKFHFQLRFIQDDKQEIDFGLIKDKLRKNIEVVKYTKKLCLLDSKKYTFLISLEGIGVDLNSTQLIQKKETTDIAFTIDNTNSSEIREFTKDLATLFIPSFFQSTSETLYFGYAMPSDITDNNIPLFCALIYSEKNLTNKINLYPTDAESLNRAVSILKENPYYDLRSLDIPSVNYALNLPDNEISTRMDLQAVICEILIHLKKTNFFRKKDVKKTTFFTNLFKDIASDKPIEDIATQLNAHDTWEYLAQHRDFWGFFSLFSRQTHSVIAWEELNKIVKEFKSESSPSQTLSPN